MSLEHRIPGRPEWHYLVAAGGYWLYHGSRFVGLFATRRDLAAYLDGWSAG